MRKNRKVTKRMSVMATNSMRLGSVALVFFVMVILHVLASSRNAQLQKSQGELEKSLARLEQDRQREESRWDMMKAPDKIEIALIRHGLSMKSPRYDQWVRMRNDGSPQPGQPSVAKIRERGGKAKAAQYRRRQR